MDNKLKRTDRIGIAIIYGIVVILYYFVIYG